MTGDVPQYRLNGLCVRHAGSGLDTPCILKDLNLEIRSGEQVAVIGPSGAGKTTLLSALALAREPHEGRLEAFGVLPWEMSSRQRHRLRSRLFLAPQVPPLPPRQRVVSAVLAGRLPQWSLMHALASLFYPRDAAIARRALALFSLEDKLFLRVDRLSGGERQRVSLARMLVAQTEVMLVDEPLSALDPTMGSQTLAELQAEATLRKATLICGLHQVELAHAQFPRMVALREGRVAFDLPRREVTQELLAALYDNARPEPAQAATAEPPPGSGNVRYD